MTDSIATIINSAEEIRDPLDDLIERAKADAGAPFVAEMTERLAVLSKTDKAAFERWRAQLKAVGVRVGELDRAIAQVDRAWKAPTQGTALEWEKDEPWPQPVNGVALLEEIVTNIRRFLVLPEHAAEAMALWAVVAHTLDVWIISPRLAFVSPEKRCGKTTALSIMQHLVPKPLPASNITAAAVFRSIEMATPTLLIDEADTFLRDSNDLRGILNSGHNRAQAYVIRTVGDDHTPARFRTWAPVVIAMIGELPDVLNDRSIAISLRRKRPQDSIERFRLDRVQGFQPLRRMIVRWAADALSVLRQREGGVPQGLHDRAADNGRPLIAIADVVGGDWPELARRAALALTDLNDEGSASTLVLRDLKALFEEVGADRLATQFILDRLHQMEERPWPEWRQGKPLTARQLSSLLRPFGATSGTLRFANGGMAKGFTRKSLEDAFGRYVPDAAVTASQPPESNYSGACIAVTGPTSVTDPKIHDGKEINGCDVVTDASSQEGARTEDPLEIPEFLRRTASGSNAVTGRRSQDEPDMTSAVDCNL
jgi:putative DNA primase/helicase